MEDEQTQTVRRWPEESPVLRSSSTAQVFPAHLPQITPLSALANHTLHRIMTAFQAGQNRVLVPWPAGLDTGPLIAHLAIKFRRVLLLAEQREHLESTFAAYSQLFPQEQASLVHGAVQDLSGQLVGAVIPTLLNRLSKLPAQQFDLLVLQDCHRPYSTDWLRVVRHLKPRLTVGFTPYPLRQDGVPVALLLGDVHTLPETPCLTDQELGSAHYRPIPTGVSLSTQPRGGDFDPGQLELEVNTLARNRKVLEELRQQAPQQPALGWALSVRHARDLAALARSQGLLATWTTPNDPDLDHKRLALARGSIQLLFSLPPYTADLGLPQGHLRTLLWARPTLSTTLYQSAMGPALFSLLAPGPVYLLDFIDQHPLAMHGLPSDAPSTSREHGLLPATARQLWQLSQLGYDPTVGWTRWAAEHILGGLT